ncbi:aspartyl-tRNA synthetase [Apiospora arundinis]
MHTLSSVPNPLARITQSVTTRLRSNSSPKSPKSLHSSQSSQSSNIIKEDASSEGKGSRRSEDRRNSKLSKDERIHHERESIDSRRKKEFAQALVEDEPEVRARYGQMGELAEFSTIEEISELPVGTEVAFRARIFTQRRVSAHLDFVLFRDQTHSIQGVLTDGTLKAPHGAVRSATHSNVEVDIHSIHLVNPASNLPGWDNYEPSDSLHTRLMSRVLDLRHPANHAIFKIRSTITRTFRDTLDQSGFLEIQTPKLQPAATESGASVFKVNYFGRTAFLAQSPQLAKQMAISADMNKVFEVGPVFRAENSNTHRHLTEYTGLDIEMALHQDYHEMMMVVDRTLKAMIKAAQAMPEIQVVRQRWPSEDAIVLEETPVLHFLEGIEMLRADGREVDIEDLSTRDEIRLGELVKEKYGSDLYILDKFPANARPFYTHRDDNNPEFTNSFDIFLRGQEICTGGQRIHDAKLLRESMARAKIREDDMTEYLSAFDLGAPPHAGAGLGLERVVFLLLALGDAPPIEKLIANYGDASNTSWLDDRFEIWRHPNGAAIGWAQQDRFAMVVGDPLCDQTQYADVTSSFIKYVTQEKKLTPVWMLVSESVQHILAQNQKWRTLSCTEEQRVDSNNHHQPENYKQNLRRVEREGIDIDEVTPDDDFMKRADKAIEAWKASRSEKGKQVHLTEIRPWVDQEHRRYFTAEKNGEVQCMVVLAQLAPRHGWQVKWAMDFPGSASGTIEVLIEKALNSVSGPVTFGAGVSEKLTPGARLSGVRAKFLANSYELIVKSLRLTNKASFREKFGVVGESVYICYPRSGVGVQDLKEIVKFFED